MLSVNSAMLKGLLPKDLSNQQFIKRIVVVTIVFGLIGIFTASQILKTPVLNSIVFLLFAVLFGVVDTLISKQFEQGASKHNSALISSTLLAITGVLAAVIPMIRQGSELLAFGALLFASPSISMQLIWNWDNKPKTIPPYAAILPWRTAFIEGLLARTRFYFIFHIRHRSKIQKVGYSVNPQVLLTPDKEITLQKLYSNWVIRENDRVRDADLIPLFYRDDQGSQHPIQWVFSKRRFILFKAFVSPFSRISKFNLLWWPKIRIVEGRLRLNYVICFTVESKK